MLYNSRYAYKEKAKKWNHLSQGLTRAYRDTKIFFTFLQASGVFVDNLVEFSTYKYCCTRRNASVFALEKLYRAVEAPTILRMI